MQNQELEYINLTDLLVYILKNYLFIFVFIIICIATAVIYNNLATPTYISDAMILPLSSEENVDMINANSLASQLVGMNVANNSGEKIRIIFKSHVFAEEIYSRFENKLNAEFFPKIWDSIANKWLTEEPLLESKLATLIRAIDIKTGENDISSLVLIVSVMLKDPVLAKDVLTACIDHLRVFVNETESVNNNFTLSYISSELEKNKIQMLHEGQLLNDFSSEYSIQSKTAMVDVLLSSADRGNDSKVTVPVSIYLRYLSSRQTILENINAILENQLQMFKIQSNKRKTVFQILKRPSTPTAPVKPRKRFNIMVSVVFGFAGGVFLLCCKYFIGKLRADLKTSSN